MPKPFLKWVGGKRQLLPELRKLVPPTFKHYYEPFLGGGALFFDLCWKGTATLGDTNERLIRTYLGVRNNVQAVIDALEDCKCNREVYYDVRDCNPDKMSTSWEVAAWLIYLNKTGFNGLYRVNKSGKFNVPFGRHTNPLICDEIGLRECALALRKARLVLGDFEKTVKYAEAGDFVYFDPPYIPVNETSNFTGYTKDAFGLKEHIRLRDCTLKLRRRGVYVMLSNADVPLARDLYREFRITRVLARRSVNCNSESRGAVGEIIIT
jgi:DNA adenine methylase